jgi:DNA gyrase/topoisomerase IV subunit B
MTIGEASYKKGNYIFIKDNIPDYFYIVKEGSVKVVFDNMPDVIYNRGEFFGEFSILTNSKRRGTAIALNDVVLRRIDKKDFYDFLRIFPDILYKVILKYSSYIEKIDMFFGGETLKTSDELEGKDNKVKFSFQEGLESFFDGKYGDAVLIMKSIIESNSEEKWQAKCYLALSYAKLGKDANMCKDILNEVISQAPTPAERELAKSIMAKIK